MQADISYTWNSDGTNPKAKYVIFSPYRCKVTFPDGEWGVFGRGGGLDAIKSVQTFGDTDKSNPCITVGNFCDLASHSRLLAGGEHFNDKVINASFLYFPLARTMGGQAKPSMPTSFSRGAITIGSNVVISSGVIVRSGVTIGDGAVIGAGSVVIKDVPPYAIVAGNPARFIRYRVEENYIEDLLRIAWWNWDTSFLGTQMAAIYTLDAKEFVAYCKDLTPPKPKDEDGVLLFRMDKRGEDASLIFTGAEMNGRLIPELPPRFLEYIMQLNGPKTQPVTVCPNLFSLCGLNPATV